LGGIDRLRDKSGTGGFGRLLVGLLRGRGAGLAGAFMGFELPKPNGCGIIPHVETRVQLLARAEFINRALDPRHIGLFLGLLTCSLHGDGPV
jgi:hypothetical protein